MQRDNVIWVDFRLSKSIRDGQLLSFSERMRARSTRTRDHIEASKNALEAVKQMLNDSASDHDARR